MKVIESSVNFCLIRVKGPLNLFVQIYTAAKPVDLVA